MKGNKLLCTYEKSFMTPANYKTLFGFVDGRNSERNPCPNRIPLSIQKPDNSFPWKTHLGPLQIKKKIRSSGQVAWIFETPEVKNGKRNQLVPQIGCTYERTVQGSTSPSIFINKAQDMQCCQIVGGKYKTGFICATYCSEIGRP